MKKLIVVAFYIIYSLNTQAQDNYDFKLLRQDENYSYLKNDTAKSWYKKMKYSPLGNNKDNYLSMGGDIRYQYFYFKNENWGESVDDKDGYVFSRFITHADLHVGDRFRTFLQLQSSQATGKAITSPVDENALDLQQLFFDYNIPLLKTGIFNLRVGRQELSYGAQRLVSVGEGPNNRQAFDAVKASFKKNNFSGDVFYSHHVKDYKGIFDDGFDRNTKFFGSYITWKKVPILKNVDLYYFGLWKRTATFDDGAGRELRHSIGSRIWYNSKTWRYDFEGVYQFGKFGDKQIQAWTISSNTGYKFNSVKFTPEVGLKSELISGDRNYGDNKLQTFNPLFPRGAYFGLAALIGPVNLVDIHPSVKLTLIENKLTGTVDYDAFWRLSKNDGLYGPNVALTYSGKNTNEKFIGQQTAVNLDYTPNNFLSFTAEFTWFKAEGYLKAASPGKDIVFTGLTTQLKF